MKVRIPVRDNDESVCIEDIDFECGFIYAYENCDKKSLLGLIIQDIDGRYGLLVNSMLACVDWCDSFNKLIYDIQEDFPDLFIDYCEY